MAFLKGADMDYSRKISERMWNQPDKGELEAEREQTFIDDIVQKSHIERELLDSIDGIESINLHADHNGAIGLAAKYARDNRLIVSGGSDFHKPHHLAACIMRTKELPRDSYDIADILRSRDYFFDISGSFLFPYEY
jgi:hypothetical protein